MSICRTHYVETPNALTFRMSREQVRVFRSRTEIAQSSRLDHADHQAVSCGSGDRKSSSPEGAALNTWNRQLMTSDRRWWRPGTAATDSDTVVGEIRWSPMPETTGWAKKVSLRSLHITSSNTSRFSKFFHCHILQEICNKVIINYSTSPQTCCYTTLWNIYVRKLVNQWNQSHNFVSQNWNITNICNIPDHCCL